MSASAASLAAPAPTVLVWRESPWALALFALAAALTWALFAQGIEVMLIDWHHPEFSHGWVVPVIAAFIVWQRKDRLRRIAFPGAWGGVLVVAFGLFARYAGELGTLYTVIQLGLVIVLAGLALAYLGWRAFALVWAAFALLFLMVPLPDFVYNRLSNELQLLSSQVGVAVVRLFGISVHLSGNVIDLGTMTLQVAEACDGVRYLFPLLTLGLVVAYYYQGAFWQRALIALSTIPITVLMNGLRIGLIGVTVEHWGPEMAQGLLHDLEGFGMFGGSFAVLVAEVLLLARFTGDRRPLRTVLGLTFPARAPKDARIERRPVPLPLAVAVAFLALALAGSTWLPPRADVHPARRDLLDFPLSLGEWKARPVGIEDVFIHSLKVTDHLMLDLADPKGRVVSLWVAYYASQKKGESAHSPATCLPGGGYRVESLAAQEVPGVSVSGVPLRVNRSVMRMGEDRQLVWYWFQQRGRVVTNEYLAKWYIFWDAVTRQRTDGALVRLMMTVPQGMDVAEGDAALASVAREVAAHLPEYVPD